MSYLLDKKNKRKKMTSIFVGVLFLFVLFLFKGPLWNGLYRTSAYIFRPVVIAGNNLNEKLSGTRYFFSSKKTLLEENTILKNTIAEMSAHTINYATVLDENTKLKEILSRKESSTNFIVAAILAKPNQSLYDTLLIDSGSSLGVSVGDTVFALGDVPIGKIAEVTPLTAKVILFSTSGEKTEVVLSGKDTFFQIIGRGGGNFEMIVPRDFVLEKDAQAVLPGITARVVALVQGVVSDPRDSYQKAILTSPVNIQELKFVQIKR